MLTGENVLRGLITKWTKHFVNEEKGKRRLSDDQEYLILLFYGWEFSSCS